MSAVEVSLTLLGLPPMKSMLSLYCCGGWRVEGAAGGGQFHMSETLECRCSP